MTENEAIKVLKDEHSYGYELNKACLIAIKALEEIQQYRAIGTVEEVKSIVNIGKWGYRKGYAKAIDEFTHQLKENLNQEFPSNYESTGPYFSLENARLIVDDVAEQMKAGGIE